MITIAVKGDNSCNALLTRFLHGMTHFAVHALTLRNKKTRLVSLVILVEVRVVFEEVPARTEIP